jgi:WD40 repeat protein
VPRDLETIVLKAIAREPAQRYATAAALAEDLLRYLEDRPIRARRISWAGRLLRWGRRNQAVASLLMSVVVTLAVGFAVSTAQWMRAERHADREAALREKETALRADMARELYTSDMLAVQQAWEAGSVKRMGDLLLRHIPEHGQTDWRGFEWDVFMHRHQHAQPIRTLPVGATVWNLAATPEGQTLAALVFVHAPNPADERSEVTLWDAATDWKPRTFSKPPGTFWMGVALSPDGRRFATGSAVSRKGHEAFVTIWDAATGKQLQRGPEDHGTKVSVGGLAFSPDGKNVLWGDWDKTINLWDPETGAVRTFKGHKDGVFGVAFDPRGRWIASGSSDGTVKLWDPKSGDAVHTFPNLNLCDVAFSPDGRHLAAGTDSGARIWDLTSPKPREIVLRGHANATTMSVAFSADGRYLAAGSSSTVRLWEVESGEARATLRGHSSLVWGVAFLDGGRMLASGSTDRTVKLWDVAQALSARDALTAHSTSVESLVFTPDGQNLISGGSDALIRRWDVATGRPLAPLGIPEVNKPVYHLAISPDGRTLADPRVGVWELETGRPLERPSQEADTSAVAFSPVDAILATGHDSGAISLWDAAKLKRLVPPKFSHAGSVSSLAFSPKGRILASASLDQKLILWDMAAGGELVSKLVGHTADVTSVAFAPDGRARLGEL